MKEEWLRHCLTLSRRPASFYSGGRKIHREVKLRWTNALNDVSLEDAGFTRQKLAILNGDYYHPESHAMALSLWQRRLKQAKYGSVSFTTYNHTIKRAPESTSKRGSVMGPCIQSVSITLMPNHRHRVDVFYRTTELYKKFPADIVLLNRILLPEFNLDIERMTFYFANVTSHSMYFVTIIPLLEDPIQALTEIKKADPHFHDWIVKWSARYICPEHNRGIDKFAQAKRVQVDALNRIKEPLLGDLIKYFNDTHPGYRRQYIPPEQKKIVDGDPSTRYNSAHHAADKLRLRKNILADKGADTHAVRNDGSRGDDREVARRKRIRQARHEVI
jgi:hypothetical protein